ncbi:MAG: RIP metalloprotease RseP [Candidatus Acetothermia bacterium]
MLTLLLFLAVISLLIAIHEGGHLISAKLAGVWVHEYSIGFGPALYSRDYNETTYSIKPIPFGGYVRMAGEDVSEEDSEDQQVPEDRKFYSQSPGTKALISVSGPLMNILTAVLIMIFVVGLTGTPRISIFGFMEGSPVEGSLRVGDQIMAIEGKDITSTNEINNLIQSNKEEEISITVRRDGELLTYSVVPTYYEDQGRYMLGVELGTAMTNKVNNVAQESFLAEAGLERGDTIVEVNGEPVNDGPAIIAALEEIPEGKPIILSVRKKGEKRAVELEGGSAQDIYGALGLETIRTPVGPIRAITDGLEQIKNIMVLTYQGLRLVIRGNIPAGEAVTGPVGIANMLGQSARQGLYPLFFLIALISLNLGLINLVPFPALDGSRIGYAAYEFIRGKPIPPEKEGLINSIGFIILIGLMVFITYKDIVNFFT